MAKQPRVILPNTPHHIVQRGHKRKPGQIYLTSDKEIIRSAPVSYGGFVYWR